MHSHYGDPIDAFVIAVQPVNLPQPSVTSFRLVTLAHVANSALTHVSLLPVPVTTCSGAQIHAPPEIVKVFLHVHFYVPFYYDDALDIFVQ